MKMKESREKISMLTCYDYSTARLMESSGINMILVGDSLGNTMLGYPDTLSVTMEDMIHHGAAVVRGCNDIFVVVDMPFMSYQTSVYDAVVNAGRLIKETGCNAVKLEGGAAVKDQIKAITDAGIPVVAHIGMTPQSVNAFGGFKVQGKSEAQAARILQDAYDVQEAGAFMVVLECVPAKLAALISEKLAIPTIGIGAGEGCDGAGISGYAGYVPGLCSEVRKAFCQCGRDDGAGVPGLRSGSQGGNVSDGGPWI